MQNRVSNRDKATPADASRRVCRKPESNSALADLQLLPVWPKDICNRTPEGRRKLIAIIERELRKERRRGVASDRAYDITRHARLARLLREERTALRRITQA
jgi:hypothetical protein